MIVMFRSHYKFIEVTAAMIVMFRSHYRFIEVTAAVLIIVDNQKHIKHQYTHVLY
jgi:hypothetical protein